MQQWKELVPIDVYQVHTTAVLQDFDRKVLTNLYQPLIGAGAFGLYLTLWNELEKEQMWGDKTTHHTLMMTMDTSLQYIYTYRQKLEAIGLLKTFVTTKDHVRHFIYELLPPLVPKQFFADMILAVFLHHRLGSEKYSEIRRRFLDEAFQTDGYVEVTQKFYEVYQSISPREVAQVQQLSKEHDGVFHERKEEAPTFSSDLFDFELFYEGLAEHIIPLSAITHRIKETIVKLAYLYNVDHIQMKNAIFQALTHDNQIDEEKLRRFVREWFQLQNSNQLPAIVERIQPVRYQTIGEKEPQTEEEHFIKYVETTSPIQFYFDHTEVLPSEEILKRLENIMLVQKLPAGVVNILILYVLKRSNGNFPKTFVNDTASQWATKKIKTVKEALHFSKESYGGYKEWLQGKEKQPKQYKRKPIREEQVPDWLNKPVEETKEVTNTQKAELEEMMKSIKTGRIEEERF